MKQRYAVRFPGVTYGQSDAANDDYRGRREESKEDGASFTDPDLLSGVIDAPPALAMEMAELIRFKTSTLTAFGLQRNGVWGEETASQKIEHLGLMFGALAAHPRGPVQGYGVPPRHLTFGLAALRVDDSNHTEDQVNQQYGDHDRCQDRQPIVPVGQGGLAAASGQRHIGGPQHQCYEYEGIPALNHRSLPLLQPFW